ncbi:virion structural protein [Pectobacterium phage vB_PcaM_CBB]|uniref:Structural protein n=1 Tax=Pectobacterium phage vB_PcaM_CBB TaxID=2772511 RepID=A0A1L2CUU8_9CAUD|nr:virion structural protein [Pectobacterium phage vB_PcaM_CBB]AMM43777.1 structural protein [Pectobacterium phage vB_PcaM_CBB]
MFKSLDNNSSIPNNYVYTSNKGTEYMYLDGSWLNCETMSTVASTHNFKMNQSAIRQIAEHNQSNTLQIGKKYIINESEYVYVGRNNFTLQGSLLTENINSRVKMLLEAGDSSRFKNIKLGSTENIEIPDKFNMDGYTYNKEKGQWWGKNRRDDGQMYTGYVTDKQMSDELTSDAIERIQHYNKTDPYPVGTTVDYDGKTAVWNGDKFIVPGRGEFPDGFTTAFNDYFETEYKPSQGKNEDTKQEDSSTGSSSNNSNASGASNNANSESSTEIPNGYVYTSGKNKSYYKKNGQWFSADTKKPINSSSAVPLERAAKAAIDKHNATAAVKIGDTFKSKKGITYKYVGGTRFISDNGKLLPKDTAQTVLNNLWKQADERKAQDQQSNQDEQPVQDTAQNDQQGSPAPAPQPESDPSQNDNPSQGNEPLKGLADQIKSNPEARRIIVLLSRGDDLSLLAADILLSGQQKEVAQILNSLNNEE